MTIALLLIELILAAVFLTAGMAKLIQPSDSAAAVAGFGVPARFASKVSAALACTEVAVGVALLTPSMAWWGAAGALLLLLIFASFVAANLARRRAPECFCLG